ncbi:MAG: acyl carrier protein [Flavobacteriales bacterium]|jgi:acyl carrier protein|nr:acyl carrier protein [Flavobacteriales bacterium]
MSTEPTTELKQELKARIIQHLNLPGVTVESIADDTPLFGEGLGLDSIDVLELIVLMDRHYGVRISDPQEGRSVFQNVTTMAEHIMAKR